MYSRVHCYSLQVRCCSLTLSISGSPPFLHLIFILGVDLDFTFGDFIRVGNFSMQRMYITSQGRIHLFFRNIGSRHYDHHLSVTRVFCFWIVSCCVKWCSQLQNLVKIGVGEIENSFLGFALWTWFGPINLISNPCSPCRIIQPEQHECTQDVVVCFVDHFGSPKVHVWGSVDTGS